MVASEVGGEVFEFGKLDGGAGAGVGALVSTMLAAITACGGFLARTDAGKRLKRLWRGRR